MKELLSRPFVEQLHLQTTVSFLTRNFPVSALQNHVRLRGTNVLKGKLGRPEEDDPQPRLLDLYAVVEPLDLTSGAWCPWTLWGNFTTCEDRTRIIKGEDVHF